MPFLEKKLYLTCKETELRMQVLGWISILTGLFHLRNGAGIFLVIIGIAVVYFVRKSKKTESELIRTVFQDQIKMIRRKKEPLGRNKQDKSAFPADALTAAHLRKIKKKNTKKSGWFIYTK